MPIVAPNGFIHTCEWLKDDSADDGLLDAVGRTCCRKPQGGLLPRVFKPLASPLSLSLSLSLLRSFFGPICLFSEKRVTAGTSSLPAVICSVFWRSFGAIVESFGCLLRSFGSKKTKKNNRRHQLLFGTLFWEGLNVLESPNIPPSTEMGSKTKPKIYLQNDIWPFCLPVKKTKSEH